MKNKKILKVYCSICKNHLEIEVPSNLAENRKSYPFGYIDVHGDPQHALMLYLDSHLQVRDEMAYHDLTVAKEKNRELQNLNRMSESETLSAIFNDPLRYEIYSVLKKGPLIDEDLFEYINNIKTISEAEFNLLLIPFVRAGIIRGTWMKDNFKEAYFLVGDFLACRIPSRLALKQFSRNSILKPFSEEYNKELNAFLGKYLSTIVKDKLVLRDEIKNGLQIISDISYKKVFHELRRNPLTKSQLLELINEEIIDELLKHHYLKKINTKPEAYYVIFTEIKLKRFVPEYLVNVILEKLENKEISKEIAETQLDFLYNVSLT